MKEMRKSVEVILQSVRETDMSIDDASTSQAMTQKRLPSQISNSRNICTPAL